MPKSRALRWLKSSVWADRCLAAIALSPVVVLLVRQFTELANTSVPCCDFASLELGTRAFLRGEQFVGLYSREGWRHPGPAPFLWSSVFRPLPGRSFAEHQIAAASLSLLALGTVVVASWSRVSTAVRSVVVTVVAVFILRFDIDAFRVPWNPYGAFLWSLIAVVSTAVFVRTRSALWVAAAVFSGSMAAQTHIGAAPTAAVCLGVILVIIIRSRHRRGTTRLSWTAGGVFSALWFFPFADLAFGNRNLGKIFTHSGTPSVAMDRSDVMTGSMWILGNSPGRIGDTFGPSSPFVDARQVIVLDIVAIVVVLGLAGVALVRWRREQFTAVLAALALASCALTVGALVVSNGPFLRYLLLPIAGLGLILWIVAGSTMTSLLQRHERNVIKLLAWPIVITLTVFSILGISQKHFTDAYVTDDVETVVRKVQDSCSSLPETSVVQIAEDVEWFDALPVIVAVDRCVTVRVLGHVGFLAGQPYQAKDGATPNVFLSTTGTPSDTTLIASSDVLNVSVAKSSG